MGSTVHHAGEPAARLSLRAQALGTRHTAEQPGCKTNRQFRQRVPCLGYACPPSIQARPRAVDPAVTMSESTGSIRPLRSDRRRALAMVAATAAACLLASAAVHAKTPGEVEVGALLRDATMQGLNGPPKRLSDFRGRPLIINVWASWCGPCRAEMASLERLAWSEHAGKFAVIGISTDDYPEKARALLTQTNATLSHFIDQKLLLENMLGADRLPLTVLVDAQGKVLEKVIGAKQWDGPEAVQLISRVFKGQPTGPKAGPGTMR